MFYTYILQGSSKQHYYIGVTSNLELRVWQHKNGRFEVTKGMMPLELVYFEACIDQNDAQRRKRYFKSETGRMFLRKRIESFLLSQGTKLKPANLKFDL